MPRPSLGLRTALLALACSMVFLAACKKKPPETTANTCFQTLVLDEGMSTCEASPNDYQPRSGNTHWPACISDGEPNQYQPIQPDDISTLMRVAAFGEMAPLLWNNPDIPSSDDFTQARVIYSTDEGLDSRVQRREDVHFPVLPGCLRCNEAGNAMQGEHAERCAGPIKLAPIIHDAFQKGIEGKAPLIQARRIEAALLWFLYLSSLSEAQTCANEPKNCDSAWAYYTGGTSRNSPSGLAAYVHSASPQTHHQAYDAALAVRCWRDLDQAVPASDTGMQYRALKQYDKALSRGMAHILRQNVIAWEGAYDEADEEDEDALSRQASVQTLFELMEKNLLVFIETGALQQSPGAMQELKNLIDRPSASSFSRINELMDDLFPCE